MFDLRNTTRASPSTAAEFKAFNVKLGGLSLELAL